MPAEVHISSLVVHSTPKRVQGVIEAIARMPGARVHGSSAAGKVVVTIDADTLDEMAGRVGDIQRTDGVLSAALVYQYADTVEAMNEEIPDAH
jgi:nitrate reductase NapD